VTSQFTTAIAMAAIKAPPKPLTLIPATNRSLIIRITAATIRLIMMPSNPPPKPMPNAPSSQLTTAATKAITTAAMRADVKLATLSPRFSLDDKTQNSSHLTYLLFVDGGMDSEGSNPDIAIVVGNKIRIRTGCSGRSNNRVILC
jgi:hypothetical protein